MGPNEHFRYKSNTLFLKHWIKSGFIYVKDLFNDDGTFVNEQYVFQKLSCRTNRISEFVIVKICICKLAKSLIQNVVNILMLKCRLKGE